MKRSITPAALGLIIINVLIHLGVNFSENEYWLEFQDKFMRLRKVDIFGLHDLKIPPGTPEFNAAQPLGSAFAHGTHAHLLLNMMCLFFFGPALERRMGTLPFLFLYLFCAVVGGFIAAFCSPTANPSLGASGAICGLLVAFAWLFPKSRMGLFIIPAQIPSRIFTGLFAAISFGLVIHSAFAGSSVGGISHIGHLAGMIAGAIFMVGYLALTKDSKVRSR